MPKSRPESPISVATVDLMARAPYSENIRRAIDEAQSVAEARMEAFFWPLAKAATTEAEARDIIARMPESVAKLMIIDYFLHISKVISKVTLA